MRKTKIVIASKSFIILKGLDFILKEIEDVEVIWRNTGELNLLSFILQSDADFAFLSFGMISKKEMPGFMKYFPGEKYPKLICLADPSNTESLQEVFTDSIDLNGTRIEIAKSLNRIIEAYLPRRRDEQKNSELSEREKNIVRHVALGNTNKEIGEKLFISTHTVITHRKNITQKLEIKTVSGLTVYAILNNIVTMEEISK